MNVRNTRISAITLLTAAGLLAAGAAGAEPAQGRHRSNEQVEACIKEIGRHASYEDASRVVHWVAGLQQRTLAELEIRVETTVYPDEGDQPAREYSASCVAGPLGKIVEFRIDPAQPNSGASRR
jgi:hypothetical protein